MGKRNLTEQLQADIEAALAENERLADLCDEVNDRYAQAVAAGDMDAARKHKEDATRLETEARTFGDRVTALREQEPLARAKDAQPGYAEACKRLASVADHVAQIESEAQRAADAYMAAVKQLDSGLSEFFSATTRVRMSADEHGFEVPDIVMNRLKPRMDLIDEARRHARIGSGFDRAAMNRGMRFTTKAA